jgi:hypothetical protein
MVEQVRQSIWEEGMEGMLAADILRVVRPAIEDSQ